jgi:hypothetical protein
MKLKNEKGAIDKKQYGALMDDLMSDAMKHPGLARPEDFEVLSPSEAATSTTDAHGIQRTGLTGGHSAYSARPNYVEPPATPLTKTRPPKKSKA